MLFAQQNTSAHAPSIALLDEGRTSPSRPTETTPCLTTEMTVADPGALAGHPQLKAPEQQATELQAEISPIQRFVKGCITLTLHLRSNG